MQRSAYRSRHGLFMATLTSDIDNTLIAALAARVRVLERRLRVTIERYACHTEDCPAIEGYPCTCGVERLEI